MSAKIFINALFDLDFYNIFYNSMAVSQPLRMRVDSYPYGIGDIARERKPQSY